MSDPLGLFLHELIVCVGKSGVSISIISDNAKRVQDADFVRNARRRRAPGRSASTPLNHMSSRWEPTFGLADDKSFHRSPGGRKSRWESDCMMSAPTIEMMRPKRPLYKEGRSLPLVCDDNAKTQLKSPTILKNIKMEVKSSNLPDSLRSLPY